MARNDEDERCAEFPEDGSTMHRLEVDFATPVFMTHDQDRRLHRLLTEVVQAPYNQPKDGIHWVSGYGSKPRWSQTDAAFLGKPADPQAPETGEPAFDDNVYAIETTARGFVSEKERSRVVAERLEEDALEAEEA